MLQNCVTRNVEYRRMYFPVKLFSQKDCTKFSRLESPDTSLHQSICHILIWVHQLLFRKQTNFLREFSLHEMTVFLFRVKSCLVIQKLSSWNFATFSSLVLVYHKHFAAITMCGIENNSLGTRTSCTGNCIMHKFFGINLDNTGFGLSEKSRFAILISNRSDPPD